MRLAASATRLRQCNGFRRGLQKLFVPERDSAAKEKICLASGIGERQEMDQQWEPLVASDVRESHRRQQVRGVAANDGCRRKCQEPPGPPGAFERPVWGDGTTYDQGS